MPVSIVQTFSDLNGTKKIIYAPPSFGFLHVGTRTQVFVFRLHEAAWKKTRKWWAAVLHRTSRALNNYTAMLN